MIRPFSLVDIRLVRRLQHSSVPLAIEQILTHPRAPLWVALTAPWPWAGVGVATYVFEDSGQAPTAVGFVQLMKRATRPEADLLHLAPALPAAGHSDPTGEAIWRQLLAHSCLEAGRCGLQRLFASVPGDGPEPALLRAAGFSLYARETIYRLAPDSGLTAQGIHEAERSRLIPPGFRSQLPQDSWALQQLYARSTPRLVQQAEGAITGEVGSPPLSWWEPNGWQGIVWAPAGEVRGAVQTHFGRAGHWLRIWGASDLTARELRELIGQGLAVLNTASLRRRRVALPIYASVRDYEVGLSGALISFGFAPYTDRARFVKHSVIAVREPLPVPLAALEVRQEVPAHMARKT